MVIKLLMILMVQMQRGWPISNEYREWRTCQYSIAYLTEDIRNRKNLTIRAESMVDRVLFNGKKAVGVRLVSGEEIYAKEVILSAGTYGSAAILLRSGVGPSDQSNKLGIPVVADLPVGLNLMDHPFYYNAYAANLTE